MKTAIVMLRIERDETNAKWMRAGLLSKRVYAKNVGADFVEITEPKFPGPIAAQKYQIGGMLDTYDRIFYLDADTFIAPDAPDIFDAVPHGCFGIFDESQSTQGPRMALLAWLGRCPSTFYANNGVFVCDRSHRWLFDWKGIDCRVYAHEQTLMTQRLWEALHAKPYPRVLIHWLSKSWNYMPRTWIGGEAPGWIPEPQPEQVFVHHFPCHRPEERLANIEALNRRYGL